MNGCLSCGRGFHRECKRCRKGKCHSEEVQQSESIEVQISKRRSEDEYLDPKSTGRKRAAKLYPIDSEAPCEWQGKKDCGGGRRPIIGCLSGKQEHRHHGPVKNTLKNTEGNVHRICSDCHVHWHELNDLIYDEDDYRLLPHQPVPATAEEIIKNKLDWVSGEIGRQFELASTKNHEKSRNASQPSVSSQEHSSEYGDDPDLLSEDYGED